MSQNTQTPSPSHAVERIREIIVGRQLDRLEQRVALLEHASPSESAAWTCEPRLIAVEAQVEAIQDRLHRLSEGHRVETEARDSRHQEEIRRLAERIQTTAAERATPDAIPRIEAKLGQWLSDWQTTALRRADQRESLLISHLRAELVKFRDWVSSEAAEQNRVKADRTELEQRFSKVAAAARALAEAAESPASEKSSPLT
jgi:hypothetical protein